MKSWYQPVTALRQCTFFGIRFFLPVHPAAAVLPAEPQAGSVQVITGARTGTVRFVKPPYQTDTRLSGSVHMPSPG